MKALIRRAEANEKLEHYDEAIAGKGVLHETTCMSFYNMEGGGHQSTSTPYSLSISLFLDYCE